MVGYSAIVLAAGASTRMGTCKAGLPWLNGKTLLSYQVEQLQMAGMTPIVVLGTHNCDRQRDCPPETQILINPCSANGKVSSIQIGLQHLPPSLSGLLISAVDQPRPNWIYRSLIQAHLTSNALMIAPTHQGKLGHPLLFSASALSLLDTLNEETLGLRQIVKMWHTAIQQVELNTPEILIDLNTPEHYRNSRSREVHRIKTGCGV
ncbi:nucleotidyltransferase family protein [Kovacikia minuta CCNUW1]|uniref:nucleotidyltransferase family protein n=1 Tax=Kovacikia minuta TaxID=2931930 RepID=UPI001CCD3384|nr:nucleotidyltransferase family protein [Kovacikia minuta]UBF27028.1 nucleotidyltransferase family protein [Kovacikia minuta CCNUW1]